MDFRVTTFSNEKWLISLKIPPQRDAGEHLASVTKNIFKCREAGTKKKMVFSFASD